MTLKLYAKYLYRVILKETLKVHQKVTFQCTLYCTLCISHLVRYTVYKVYELVGLEIAQCSQASLNSAIDINAPNP